VKKGLSPEDHKSVGHQFIDIVVYPATQQDKEFIAMRKFKGSATWKLLGSRTAAALLFLTFSHSFPVSAAENAQLSAVEPQMPPPQGILMVYSEHYVSEDEGVPIPHRRPVEVFNDQGRLVISQCDTFADNPSRFDLPPGHYIVASESHDMFTKVRVDIQDGEETVVPESLIEKIALDPAFPDSATSVHLDPRFCPSAQVND
jgi:hypothetical protein